MTDLAAAQRLLQAAEARAEPALFSQGALLGGGEWAPLARWARGAASLRAALASPAAQAPVQAMLSATGVYQGDIASHQPVQCALGDVLAQALSCLGSDERQQQEGDAGEGQQQQDAAAPRQAASSDGGRWGGQWLYLAQQPLDAPGLEALAADASDPPPALLGGRELSATNLWISTRCVGL